MSNWTFRDEISQDPINLSRAVLQLARIITYPFLDVGGYMQKLHDIAYEAQATLHETDNAFERAQALAQFLFGDLGFRGNADTYYDPRNSLLNDVLDRKTGIPITLSILYVDIAQRVGLHAQGIGMPGHFIVGVYDANQVLWLDPFNGGEILTQRRCEQLVTHTTGNQDKFDPNWLTPASTTDILIRVLNNLRLVYIEQQKWEEAIHVLECLLVLMPDNTNLMRDLGLLHYRNGSLLETARYLNEYARNNPNATDVALLRQNIGAILDQTLRWN